MVKALPRFLIVVALLAACGRAPAPAPPLTPLTPADTAAVARLDAEGVWRQTAYVPVYSHIYFEDEEATINLSATLTVRNTDAAHSLYVTGVDYYDTEGRLVRRYAEAPFVLGPLATAAFVVERDDTAGGVGANFLVTWAAPEPVAPPIAEAVMIGTFSALGLSFVSPGRVVSSPPGEGARPAPR